MDEPKRDAPIEARPISDQIRLGPTTIHRRTGRVETPSGARHLRAKELELLTHLLQYPATTFSWDELLQQVWQYQSGLLTRTVDQTIATLRRKIEPTPDRPRFLQTVFGIGYRLQV